MIANATDGDGSDIGAFEAQMMTQPPQVITGRGVIPTDTGFAHFSMSVTVDGNGDVTESSYLRYSDQHKRLTLYRARVTAATINGTHASFSGTGFLARGAQAAVGFTVDVDDLSADGSTDTFAISLTNDYSASGTLKRGNITIGQQGQP